MTPNTLTAQLAEHLDREMDIPLRLLLWDKIKYWRSRLIDQAVTKRGLDRRLYTQTLFMLTEQTNSIPCNALVNLPVSATKVRVPSLVLVAGQFFDYVGGVDGKSPFRNADPGTYNYVSESRFQRLFPAYEFSNDKIITDRPDLPMIRIDAIFHDPQIALQLSNECAGNTCDSWDSEFPMPGDITSLVIQSILQVDYGRRDQDKTPQVEV
jgi:hypothetical protein